MRWARSVIDEVAKHLLDLAGLIKVSEHELLTAMKVLSKADWATAEFSSEDGTEFEITSFSGEELRLKVTIRKGNTTIIKDYYIPEFLVKGDVSEVSLRPEHRRRARRPRRRKAKRG
ncbi:MAG TPA: hypothetical protein ENF78_03055 [Candidatus Bathyarchaeota archaeon]|nr:hypothetical protein [Candidatus Bathyarchaeota archaeon]